jgi:hypothetical protein
VGGDVDRVDLRRTLGYWFTPVLAIGCAVSSLLFFPFYRAVPILAFAIWGLGRFALRQVQWIAFDHDGVDLGLLFRAHYIRHPVAEFSGTRLSGVTVQDLHNGARYDLAPLWRSRRVVNTAESHGYAVVARPRHAIG